MIRREPTYLSTDVWRALWLLSKAMDDDSAEFARKVTPDSVADDILRETLKTKYPQLFEHQKQVAKLESELLKTL